MENYELLPNGLSLGSKGWYILRSKSYGCIPNLSYRGIKFFIPPMMTAGSVPSDLLLSTRGPTAYPVYYMYSIFD